MTPYSNVILSNSQAQVLLAARQCGECGTQVSPDLGLSEVAVAICEAGALFPGQTIPLPWDAVEEIAAGGGRCFVVEDGAAHPVQVFSETTGWVRSLLATEGAPTTLVGGFPMHRIKDTDPLADTREKIKSIRPVTGRVLDTATGLGYTAIEAAKTAREVITVELDPAAIEIARYNPWSVEMFERDNIRLVHGDIYEVVEEFDDGSFDRIIHDPPTMSLAGELYSEAFYRQLYRLLARRGRLFHYIGDPESRSGKRTTEGVVLRLQEAGFERVRRVPQAFGVVTYR